MPVAPVVVDFSTTAAYIPQRIVSERRYTHTHTYTRTPVHTTTGGISHGRQLRCIC